MDISIKTLIKALLSTNSPSMREKLFKDYIIENPITDKAERDDLLNFFSEQIANKSVEGKNAFAQRIHKSKVKTDNKPKTAKNFSRGIYVLDYKGGPCTTCTEYIPPGEAFRHQVHGIYTQFHIKCLNDSQLRDLAKDKTYIAAMNAPLKDWTKINN